KRRSACAACEAFSLGPEIAKRSPRLAMDTSSAVSIWRRFASTGPQRAARRLLSTGRKTTSSAALRRDVTSARAHHRGLQRVLEGGHAVVEVRARLLGQAGLRLCRADLRDEQPGILALERSRIGGAGGIPADEQHRHALHVLALQVAAHEGDV